MSVSNRKFVLTKRPHGDNVTDCLEMKTETIEFDKVPGDHVVVQNVYMSLDPAMRIWMARDSYVPKVPLNTTMRGFGVGVVVKGAQKIKKGDIVSGGFGWTAYATIQEEEVMKVDQLTTHPLNELGHIGLTAYFGIVDKGQIKEGDQVFVSTAAGAVGSLVCQIAKAKGCRVVGCAGSEEKVNWLKNELGVEAFNYKTVTLRNELKKQFPDGIDVYFDNVGGEMLEAALDNINKYARVVLCGAISQYQSTKAPTGPKNYTRLLFQQATMSGFIVMNYMDRAQEGVQALMPLLKEGKLKSRTHVEKGFERAPEVFKMLFKGENKGKLVLQISDPSSVQSKL